MKQRILLFVCALIVWCLFNWVPDREHLLTGIPVAAVVAALLGDLVFERPGMLAHPSRYFYFFFKYVPVFLWEVMKANIDVARRVVHPDLPIRPGIVKIRTTLRTAAARTLLANAITLTPGTLVVVIIGDSLYIHWINIVSEDPQVETEIIVRKFERLLERIFE